MDIFKKGEKKEEIIVIENTLLVLFHATTIGLI